MASSGSRLPIPRLPIPGELRMPLRDALTGVRRSVFETARLMEPLETILPEPVQALVHRTGERLRSEASEILDARDKDWIVSVAKLGQIGTGRDYGVALAGALRPALTIIFRSLDADVPLISETMIAVAHRAASADFGALASPSERAACLALALREHHVMGDAPGTPLTRDVSDQVQVDLALFAALLWVLVERDGEGDEAGERALLALTTEVALSCQEDVTQAFTSRAALTRLLASCAAMI